jgi:transposase
MGQSNSPASPVDPSSFTSVVGMDSGSQNCSLCALQPDKSQVIKPTEFTNAPAGFVWLLERIERLGASPDQILIGLEATSRDARESLPLSRKPRVPALEARIPDKPTNVLKPRGLRAKTDKLDAGTIARVLRETGKRVVAMCRRT